MRGLGRTFSASRVGVALWRTSIGVRRFIARLISCSTINRAWPHSQNRSPSDLRLRSASADDSDMEQKQPVDVASEPVDLNDDAEYMDTGVLHEERICTECGNDLATEGYALCSECLEETS